MNADIKLELVQVLFRHGARMVSQQESEHVGVKDRSIYQQLEFGQLTNQGKREVYVLGCALRQRYKEFLGRYERSKLYAYTSNVDRTKESLQLVLAGLYPPATESERWNPNLDWNPIAYVEGPETDVLLKPFLCKYYILEKNKELEMSKEYRQQIAKYSDFFDFMRKTTGFNFEDYTLLRSGWTYYGITIHRALNLPLPRWCSDEVLKNVQEVAEISVNAMSLNQKLKRLNGGTMIRRVIENIKVNRDAKEPRKIYLYSAHDLTMAAFIRAQDVNLANIPTTGSAVVIEKYRDVENDREFVRALFWNGKEFVVNKIGDCSEDFCPLEKYIEITKDVIPSDEELALLGQSSSSFSLFSKS